MSWRPEVIADNSGKWVPNGARYATKEEALKAVLDLSRRWTLVRDTRVVETSDPANCAWNEVTSRTEFLPESP